MSEDLRDVIVNVLMDEFGPCVNDEQMTLSADAILTALRERGALVEPGAGPTEADDYLEDAQLNAIADERFGGPFVKVSLSDGAASLDPSPTGQWSNLAHMWKRNLLKLGGSDE